MKPKRSWQEAVVRFLEMKANLRGVEKYRAIGRRLHGYLGDLLLNDIDGDTV